ncbi:hypothetical protein F4778DRAFT_735896 [Xylariomycetidae sp. FL2044]|nr:hypothetical protein F4778DRAFT_735896 [Xylariomycetidae sp. FL2044]
MYPLTPRKLTSSRPVLVLSWSSWCAGTLRPCGGQGAHAAGPPPRVSAPRSEDGCRAQDVWEKVAERMPEMAGKDGGVRGLKREVRGLGLLLGVSRSPLEARPLSWGEEVILHRTPLLRLGPQSSELVSPHDTRHFPWTHFPSHNTELTWFQFWFYIISMATIPPEKAPKPGLNIYGGASVNPVKLTIAAEELGVPYHYVNLDMATGEPKAEWFATINPNGRLPAIVHVKDDQTSVTVFESAACLLYLASEFDKEHKLSYPVGTPEYWVQLSWLSWQVAGYGPMMGQAAYFNRYATEPVPYAVVRYTSECRRLSHVLDKQLSTTPFVAGDRMTIADFACFIFAHSSNWCGVDINQFSHLKAWHDNLAQRPAFQKALQVPVPYQFSDAVVSDPDAVEGYKMLRKYGGRGIKAATDEWAAEPLGVPSDHANLE